MSEKQRESFNELHARHPEPGDVWMEMFSWSLVVLEVNDLTVNFCKTKKMVADEGMGIEYTWDLDVVEELTREEFVKYLSYETGEGFWTSMCEKKQMWAVKAALEL